MFIFLEVFGILSVIYHNLFQQNLTNVLIHLPVGLKLYLIIIMCIVVSSDIAYTYFRKTK